MANNISLAKNYRRLVDENYAKGDLFGDLTSDLSLTRQGANAKEILYRQVSIEGGLGDYSRNSGYTSSDVKVEWKTAKFEYDRGTKFALDAMDNEEIYLSTNTACSSGETSNAVMALYNDIKRASHTIRISLSSITTSDEIDKFLKAFDRNFESLNSLVRKD